MLNPLVAGLALDLILQSRLEDNLDLLSSGIYSFFKQLISVPSQAGSSELLRKAKEFYSKIHNIPVHEAPAEISPEE